MDAAELVEEDVAIGRVHLRLLRPRDPESLIDESQFDHDEFMPYWAELWPSALALAREVERQELAGARVLELGCGLGVPSLVAAARGASVVAFDWAADAIELLRRNAARNDLEVEAVVADWRVADGLVAGAPWDLVLASDVLYEERNVEPLLSLLPRLGREALLAEPGRPHAQRFLDAAADAWHVDAPTDAIYRLTR